MTGKSGAAFQGIFANPSFRRFWLAFTFSAVGDSLTRVALTWFVYERTGSALALGLLNIAFTAPVIFGGLIAGSLLDRFDRRRVMFFDNLLRAVAIGMIPLLHMLGLLQLWHIYVVAVIYGTTMMISLAGGPSLVPLLVRRDQLASANSLEMLSFTLSSVLGPPLAGLLISRFSAPAVVALDVVSYLAFAVVLLTLKLMPAEPEPEGTAPASYRLHDAFKLLLRNRVLLSTTLMYMLGNAGYGLMEVWLPIYVHDGLGGGPEMYGLALAALAIGEVTSTLIVGNMRLKVPLGTAIAAAATLSGLALMITLVGQHFAWMAVSFLLVGFLGAPLSIWAQTLRMQVIPDKLRGRTFALLRMLMLGATPLGGALAGALLPLTGFSLLIGLSATLIGGPGLAGFAVAELRRADSVPQGCAIVLG
jgi:MFS family permease